MKKQSILRVVALTFLAAVGWLFAVFVSEWLSPDPIVRHVLFGLIVSSFALALVAAFYRLEGSTKERFNLPEHAKLFGVGFLWFAVPALILLVAANLLGLVEVNALKSPLEIMGAVLLVAGLVALSEAIPEEVIMRGYVFSKLSELGGRWFTVFAQAAIFTVFAFMIGALSDPLDASFIFTFGAVLGILRSATGSVATSMGFHLACMTFQQSLGGRWEMFSVSGEAVLQMYILGVIPLSIVSAFFVSKMLNNAP